MGRHTTVWLPWWPDAEARSRYEAEACRRGFGVRITADGQSQLECELMPIRLADLLDLRDAGICDRLGFDPAGRIEVHAYVAGYDRVVDALVDRLVRDLGGVAA